MMLPKLISTFFFYYDFIDASNMNEGDSAGGHLGRSPAPPAVIDRRSNISGISQVI